MKKINFGFFSLFSSLLMAICFEIAQSANSWERVNIGFYVYVGGLWGISLLAAIILGLVALVMRNKLSGQNNVSYAIIGCLFAITHFFVYIFLYSLRSN